MSSPDWHLGVDIGGTFTDVVLLDPNTGLIVTHKVLTTPHSPLEAVQSGIAATLERAGATPEQLTNPIVHATTLVTNALIERTAARTALLTTEGFGDILRIRDEKRYSMYDLQIELPEPPVPRALVFELAERTAADGRILEEPDEAAIEAIAERLATERVEAVAIGFINAYANDANERAVAARLREALDVPVNTSSEVAPIIREYPRFVTAVLNASTIPILGPYLTRFEGWLSDQGVKGSVLLMLSNGGVVSVDVAARHPIWAVESGPAAGALAGSWFAREHELGRLLCFDMGGTTAKACMIDHAAPHLTNVFEIARVYRHLPGSGLPAAVLSVDLVEIGAGGGSIARVDSLGRLAVGPASAGAAPGPASYGRGGSDPTVTDADLLLGYFDPARFAGGSLALDPEAAERAIEPLATRAGMSIEDMAAGIHELVNQTMAAAARAHATERGADLMGTPMLAFGGAGPVHACGVAELLECPTVVFPPQASVLSAFGALVTPARVDLASTSLQRLAELEPDAVEAICEELREEGRHVLTSSGVEPDRVQFRYAVDARYEGQANELTVWLGEGPRWPVTPHQALERFEEHYRAVYGLTIPDVEVEVVTWRVSAHGPEAAVRLSVTSGANGAATARRVVRFGIDGDHEPVDVMQRAALGVGTALRGPALIEEADTTIVLRPGWEARVEADGSIVADVRHDGEGAR